MSLRIHPDTKEEVKNRVDIVDVISDHVVLKKRGKTFIGLCPFHDEKSPSFSVNPGKQMYYCFGCGTGGDAFKFLMELEKRSFSEVVLDLAKRYQIPVKTISNQEKQEIQKAISHKEQLYEVLAVATNFYQHALKQPGGTIALQYLQEKRQLTQETIEQFKLGYSPAGWDTLYRYLVKDKNYPVTLVAEAGLIKERQNKDGYYDQFRDRLMIPICDSQGRIIAFGSRTLGNEEPKYLNSPETPLFDKSRTLFGLDRAKSSIIKLDQAIIVEGYFDVIALHSFGITNVVASLGTAFTSHHSKLLLKYTESKNLIFNFDADKAGLQATQRAIAEIEPLVYAGQVQLRILNLPGGKDADEFLHSNSNATELYQTAIGQSPLWIDWQIEQLIKGKDLKSADQFQEIAQQMVKLLNRLESSTQRTHYIRYCAEILAQGNSHFVKLHAESLVQQLRQNKTSQKTYKVKPITTENSLLLEAEALLLKIYLHNPNYRNLILEQLESKDLFFALTHHRFLWQKIISIEQKQDWRFDAENQLLTQIQTIMNEYPEQQKQVLPLFRLDEKSEQDIHRPDSIIHSSIASMERVTCEKQRKYYLEKYQSLNPQENSDLYQQYLLYFYQADQRLKNLDQQRISSSLKT